MFKEWLEQFWMNCLMNSNAEILFCKIKSLDERKPLFSMLFENCFCGILFSIFEITFPWITDICTFTWRHWSFPIECEIFPAVDIRVSMIKSKFPDNPASEYLFWYFYHLITNSYQFGPIFFLLRFLNFCRLCIWLK